MKKPNQKQSSQQIASINHSVPPADIPPPSDNSFSDRNEGVVATRATQQISYSGPLPPAHELQGYEAACPGLAREIADMALRQQAHRHEMEKQSQKLDAETLRQVVTNEHNEKKTGQFLAFGVVVLITTTSCIGFFLGHPIVAAALEGSTLISLVALFLGTRQSSTSITPEQEENNTENRVE